MTSLVPGLGKRQLHFLPTLPWSDRNIILQAGPELKFENYESVQHRLSGIKKGAKILFHRHFKAQRNKFILIAELCSFSQNENIFAGWDPSSWIWISLFSKAPSTLIRFQTKTELICSEYAIVHTTTSKTITENRGIRKHSPELSDLKMMLLKTLFSSVEGENDAIWKRCRHQNRHDRAPDHS